MFPVDEAKPIHAVPSVTEGAALSAPLMSRVELNEANCPPLAIVHAAYMAEGLTNHRDRTTLSTSPGVAGADAPKVPALASGVETSDPTEAAPVNPDAEARSPIVIVEALYVLKVSATRTAGSRQPAPPRFAHGHVGTDVRFVWYKTNETASAEK